LVPFNSPAKNLTLDALDETASGGITHVGIHTLTDPGTGTNANAGEATGGSPAYARKAVTWGAAASGSKSNSGALTFDVPAGSFGFFTLWNAITGNTNNYLGNIPFGGSTALKGFFSAELTNDTFVSVAHGLANDDRVIVYDVFGEALPAGVSEGTIYWVVSATTDSFKLAATQGGAAINLTTGGEGYWQRIIPEVFGAQGQITVAAGALVLDATAV
jgi:hypothetical protein